MLKVGVSRELINPARGIPLVGYFNPRPNKGILDSLYVKAILFQQNKTTCGMVVFDLCFVDITLVEDVRKALVKAGIKFADKLIFSATHTHTGPAFMDFFGIKADKNYYKELVNKAVLCIKAAFANLDEASISSCSVNENPYSFNRRYYMKNGKVVTNPGKLNPDIVKPESLIDDEIGILKIEQNGRTIAILTTISNHNDTIGGDLVSADWPGQLEKHIQSKFGYDVDVITLIACSGNINHFDVKSNSNQTCYDEAKRIGKGYAEIILKNLGKAKEVKDDKLSFKSASLKIPLRKISKAEYDTAKKLVSSFKGGANKDLTSEDLAKGHGAVACFFAKQLVNFSDKFSGKTRTFDTGAISFGKEVAFTSLPGEPFVEVALEIKKKSPFRKTYVISHANGKAGYVPLKECFSRGGYEILPVENGGSRKDTAELFVKSSLKLLGTK